jgi:hypothetical protein
MQRIPRVVVVLIIQIGSDLVIIVLIAANSPRPERVGAFHKNNSNHTSIR